MKYYSEDDVRELVSETESMYLFAHSTPINIRFCRDCPYFISDYIPDEVGRYSGWCEWRSEGENGWHYDVMEDSFCNEDDIVDVYQFSFMFVYHILCNL